MPQERWKKKKQAPSVVPEEHGMHINDLQTDVLQRIFSLLDQTERVQKVPLVCKAWNEAASSPSLMWERVRITSASHGKAKEGSINCTRLMPWLQRRCCSIHSLFVTIASEGSAPLDRLLHATLPQLHELQEVRIFVLGGMTRQQLALLAELLHACTSLRELSVSFAPEPSFVAQDLDIFGGLSRLRALAFDMHAVPIPAEGTGAALQRWAGGFPMGLCGLSHLTELDISLRAFDSPAIVLPEEFMGLVSLQKLRLDSCGSLELPGSLAQLRRLDSVSLRQCHLDSINCLDRLLSIPSLDEVRIEDCTSEEAEMAVAWEDTMRLMPPLLELMDMFNIVCRRSVSSGADTDLLKAAARLQRMLLSRCNRLAALPPVLGTSWHCNPSRLSLRYCGLQSLPKGRYLASLKVLDLEGNSFRCIPPALAAAAQLTHLDLSCNHDLQIGFPDVQVLEQLPRLHILDLSKISERLPHEGAAPPEEVLPNWREASVHNLATLVCMRCDKGGPSLEVGMLLLGAPWLSSSSASRAPDGWPDALATAEAYVARMRVVLSPATKSSAQAAKGSRRRHIWRRIMLHVFGAGFGAALGRLSRRLCWQRTDR
ncbi:probable leucine-rich repeat protein soc-2 [Coccomyxa sp. Obi]|nr:probable leucine-rich repeat protein soc-2 [Coccomyxa sp. Obi]